jgi:hypothetical protein
MARQRTTTVRPRPRLTLDRLRELLLAFLPDYLRLADSDSAHQLDLEKLIVLPTEDPALVAATVPARRAPDLVTVLVILQERAFFPAEIRKTIVHHLGQLDLHDRSDPLERRRS